MRYHNRADAGRSIAESLGEYAGNPSAVVVSLPQGGVPVAYALALTLDLPFRVFDLRILNVPGHGDTPFGVVATGGVCVVNDHVVDAHAVPEWVINDRIARLRKELDRQESLYNLPRTAPDLWGRTVILVDDGSAQETTLRAAVEVIRALAPGQIVIASPTGTPIILDDDDPTNWHVRPQPPERLYAVRSLYKDFLWVLGSLTNRRRATAELRSSTVNSLELAAWNIQPANADSSRLSGHAAILASRFSD